jgi:3',5'-cyclic AMP phosphodiesterase CpdA
MRIQKTIALLGSLLLLGMTVSNLILSPGEPLPLWHTILAMAFALLWGYVGLKSRGRSLRRMNLLAGFLLLFCSLVEFVIPSFPLYGLMLPNPLYTYHPYIGAGFGLLVLLVSFLTRLPRPSPFSATGFLLLVVFLLSACSGSSPSSLAFRYETDPEFSQALRLPRADFPATQFLVASDLHYYDPALGTSGPSFQAYIDSDRKMLAQSQELLETLIGEIGRSPAQFVLISGDLTKDGEKPNHERLATFLATIEQGGRQVFVVPGNHDIENPDAMRYTATGTEPVPTVTPTEFAQIYREFGYGQALARDPNSLSYLAEPVPGLWLLAIDSCDYSDNLATGEPQTNGRLTQERLDWIEKVLAQAKTQKKAVLAICHHNLMEHYDSQQKNFGDYLLDDYPQIGNMLARFGVPVIFSGHYHAQDVALTRYEDGSVLYDVETGSLVSYPVVYRQVTIGADQTMTLRTGQITALPSFSTQGKDFPAYALEFTRSGVETVARQIMTDLNLLGILRMNATEIEEVVPQIGRAFIAHYGGDEQFPGGEKLKFRGLSIAGKMVIYNRAGLVLGLWQDKEPSDRNLMINLVTRDWQTLTP